MATYSSFMAELIDRLEALVKDDALLEGVSLTTDPPAKEVEGQSDRPSVRLFLPSLSEDYRPEAVSDPQIQARLTLSTEMSDGIVAHLEWLEILLDGIELNTSGTLDVFFDGTLRKPVAFAIADPFVNGQSITSQITITAAPLLVQRGARRT